MSSSSCLYLLLRLPVTSILPSIFPSMACFEQDKQLTNDATFRRAFVLPLLQWKSGTYYMFWVCVSSSSYQAYKLHAPHNIAICGLSGLTICFPHHVINAKILREKLLNIKCVLIFYTNFCLKSFSRLEEFSEPQPRMYIGVRVK